MFQPRLPPAVVAVIQSSTQLGSCVKTPCLAGPVLRAQRQKRFETLPLWRTFHTTQRQRQATTLPFTTPGPPPAAPNPTEHASRQDRRRRAADLLRRQALEQEQESAHRAVAANKALSSKSPIKKRFWKDVHVQFEDQSQCYTVHLDKKAIRNPLTTTCLEIPASKAHLSTLIALEWDLLTSVQQALRPHLIPLTSLASRAHALTIEDARTQASRSQVLGSEGKGIRYDIINTLLRYLDTDTLLCWEGEIASLASARVLDIERDAASADRNYATLRDLQISTAKPILSYLTKNVWPGIELVPSLDASGSLMPRSQPAASRAVIRSWLMNAPAWHLVALERATIAGKSLCVAVRLLEAWKEGAAAESHGDVEQRFEIETAAKACSLEVDWQTQKWGEVEDTHDVEKVDLRRQLGAAVILAV